MGDAALGFVLTEEQTARFLTVADYMGMTPYELMDHSIKTLYAAFMEKVGE